MCVSNTLPAGLYFILTVNNPLKVGTIVITVFQDGRQGWLGVGMTQGYPPSHTLGQPATVTSALLGPSRLHHCLLAWEGWGRPFGTTSSLPDPTKTGFDSSTITSYYTLHGERVPAPCLQIWNLPSHREDLRKV